MPKTDLNLMTVLEAIYDEGNTSRAGDVLFLSQSAVSHALARLRDIYQDPLFVRQGNKMLPTPLTERIITRVKSGLREIRSSINEANSFDPKAHRQKFHLGMRDTVEAGLYPQLMKSLEVNAPLVSIHNRHAMPSCIETDLNLGKLDLCIEVLKPVSEQIHHTALLTEPLVVAARKNHPLFENPNSIEEFLKYRQVLVTVLEHEPEIIDHALASRGLNRNVALRCQNTFSAIQVLINSDYLSIIPRTYAENFSQYQSIQYSDIPFDVPLVDIHLYWHERHDADPANAWLRQQIVLAISRLPTVNVAPSAMEWVNR